VAARSVETLHGGQDLIVPLEPVRAIAWAFRAYALPIPDTVSPVMESPLEVVRRLRLAAGFSQRDLARRAGTSQPAIARYEGGSAIPSWETLQRLAAACGRRLTIRAEVAPDPHDVQLAERLLDSTPAERLQALRRYAQLHGSAREKERR